MTPTEINELVGLPKQSAHRLCKTLEDEGFLTRAEDRKRLRPGRRLRELASALLHGETHHIARRQILNRIAERLGETVNFVVARSSGMHYADRVETDWPLRIQLPVGSDVPFHCTASGKAFLASMPVKARKTFVATLQLKPFTENTLSTKERLLAELQEIAKCGYSWDNEEFMEGMVAVAVPVKDRSNNFVAAVAFHGPRQRMTIADALEKREILREGAAEISTALFS